MTSQKKGKYPKLPQVFHQLFDSLNKKQMFLARMAFAEMTDAQKEKAETILSFKKAMFERAVVLGPTVWKNWDFVKDHFVWSLEEPNKVYASLWCDGKQRAIGRSVIQRSSTPYRLNVHHSMLELNSAEQDKILLHELVHMGYSGHGRDFINVCREVGGAVSGSGVTEPGVHLERKVGARYKRMQTFHTGDSKADERKAREWYRAYRDEVDRIGIEKGASPEQRKEAIGTWRVIIGT